MLEYNGAVYNDTKKKWGEVDTVYPEKQQPYVPIEQCGHPHNYLNGWKCINCGQTLRRKPRPNKLTIKEKYE